MQGVYKIGQIYHITHTPMEQTGVKILCEILFEIYENLGNKYVGMHFMEKFCLK